MTDRDAYRQWLQALADSVPDLRVICVAHGSQFKRIVLKGCGKPQHYWSKSISAIRTKFNIGGLYDAS